MKTLIYWSLVAVLLAALLAVSVLYYNREDPWQPHHFLASRDRQWILSGDQHLFDVTQRAFDLASLDGFREGRRKWIPIGGEMTPFRATFVTPERNALIGEDEFVLGVLNGAEATAYPLRVLVSHQVVNDGTQEPAVCAYFGEYNHAAAGYSSGAKGKPATFGSTGFVYRQSDVLFDLETESLFLPATGLFVAGERLGERLTLLPSAVVTLKDWLSLFPESRIMTTNTGSVPQVYRHFDIAAAPPAVRTVREALERRIQGRHSDVVTLRDGWDALSVLLPDEKRWSPGEHGFEFEGSSYTAHLGDTFGSAYVTDPDGKLKASLRSIGYILRGAVPEAEFLEIK